MKHFLGRMKGLLQVQYSTKLRGLSWFNKPSKAVSGLDSSLHKSVGSRGHLGY
jgi:hypothetical protein